MTEHEKEHHAEHNAEHHAEHHTAHHAEHQEKKSKPNIWMIASFVIAAILLASIFTGGFTSMGKLSKDEASSKVEGYIQNNVAGSNVTAKSTADNGAFYSVTLDLNGQEITSYISKDGKMLFPYAIPLAETQTNTTTTTQTPQAPAIKLEKTDKPTVDVFVMSHCPYGTQIEKGIIPVAKALGDSIDFNVRFVYYAMHGEKEVKEQLNQYCTQKEQNDKYIPYLECFLAAGDGAGCLNTAGIDTAKLKICTEATDKAFSILENLADKDKWLNGRYPLFNTDKALNEKYDVGGSPTLIINGADANSGRDPAGLMATICGAFKTAPAACSQNLSSSTPSAGFGYNATAASSGGACG